VIFTRIAWILGIAFFGFLCWLAFAGFTPAIALVVTAVVLFALVGGGNAMRGGSTAGRQRGPRS
jgi:hypothetical protein